MIVHVLDAKALFRAIFAAAVCLGIGLCSLPVLAGQAGKGAAGAARAGKTQAQKLVETTVANHHELSGLELSTTPPGKQTCVTIAATDPKELGEKCDEDEFAAMRTAKPFVEKEKDGYDVTLPLHDANGKVIGTLGMDFKRAPGQQESEVIEQAKKIAREVEKQIPSKVKLFEATK
jgi:hypothetical protein